jgi:hypothetical protein
VGIRPERGFESAQGAHRLGHRSGLAKTRVSFQQFAEVSDSNLFDFSDPIGKLFRLYFYQAGVSQRFPHSLAAAFLSHESLPQSQILTKVEA